MNKIVIIGSGFAGLSSACFLAKAGYDVTVLEKHNQPGGRARQLIENGFSFDMGPSWYWMPDIFERFFKAFGKNTGDYYKLSRLDPSYRIYWNDQHLDIPADYAELKNQFELLEPGSSLNLDRFMKEAAFKYDTGMKKLVFKPGQSFTELLDWDIIRGIFKLDIFISIKKHVSKYFKNPKLRQLLEFPVLFLGALPEKTPALYSLMNYADAKLGTWYPEGGIYSVVKAMHQLAEDLGVRFLFNQDVKQINIHKGLAVSVSTLDNLGKTAEYKADVVIGAADYHFIETELLPKSFQTYSSKYWDTRKLAPSCLLYYVGLNKKLGGLLHHSLFFDKSFEQHGRDIYIKPAWPADPLFYVCAASKTDKNIAPEGCENLFFLIPVASGIQDDSQQKRDDYFNNIVTRFEKLTGENIRNFIVYRKDFGPLEFRNEYNAFKGNAYGLANTLRQTANLKPTCRSKRVRNLFYTGQLTVPGPGVPPALISGEVAANEVIKYY